MPIKKLAEMNLARVEAGKNIKGVMESKLKREYVTSFLISIW